MRCEVLYLVIPCYNEEEVLPETTRQLTEKMNDLMARGLIAKESRICQRRLQGQYLGADRALP